MRLPASRRWVKCLVYSRRIVSAISCQQAGNTRSSSANAIFTCHIASSHPSHFAFTTARYRAWVPWGRLESDSRESESSSSAP